MDRPLAIVQNSFNAGQVGPTVQARADQSLYRIALAEMDGFRPTLQGPAVSDTGSYFVEIAPDEPLLFVHEYDPTQAYVVEATANKFRFYTNDVLLESGGVPVEVAHGWTLDELKQLQLHQSFDVLYLTGVGKPQRLVRTAADAFTLEDTPFNNGPIGDPNSDETLTVTVSGTTGNITITASDDLFDATDVGTLFEIEAADFSDIRSWEPGITISTGNKRSWSGKVYEVASGGSGRTGTAGPIHNEGTEWDGSGSGSDINGNGPYGVPWKFLYGRFGLVKITAVASATSATATVIKRLADSLVTTPTYRWAQSLFSDLRGWPRAMVIWGESATFLMGARGVTSVIGALDNFEQRDSSGDYQRDLSGQFTLPTSAEINWASADRVLVIGTDQGEYTVERKLLTSNQGGPPIFEIVRQGTHGCARNAPILAMGNLLFLQRAKRKLLEMSYRQSADSYAAPNLSRLAEDIMARGVVDMAWVQEPQQELWCVLEDGGLAALAYDPHQEVLAWFTRTLGAGMKAKSIAAATSPDGKRSDLWIAAETEGGSYVVLRKAKPYEVGDERLDTLMLDNALVHDGAPTSSGPAGSASHLAGQTVQVIADGRDHPDITIAGDGSWSIGFAASKIHIGQGFPAGMTWLKPADPSGDLRAQNKAIKEISLDLLVSNGLKAGILGQELIALDRIEEGSEFDSAPAPLSGLEKVSTYGPIELGAQLRVERHRHLPSVVLASIMRLSA